MERFNDYLDDNLSTGFSDDQEEAMHRLCPGFHHPEAEEAEDWCVNEVLSKSMMDRYRPCLPQTAA